MKYPQIPTFNVARLTNSAHKLFHEEIIEKLQQQEVPNPQLAELVRRYREAFARENSLRKIARKSFYTEQKDHANMVCGQTVGMIRATVTYVLKTTDNEEEREAGRMVSHYIRQLGLSYERKYIHRLSLYHTLVSVLRRTYGREMELLGISGLVDRLEREATAMQEAIAQRQQETMSIPRQALRQARREVDECYTAVVCALNFLSMFETEAEAREMATFCTAQIRRYRTTLSGRRAAEKPQEQSVEAEPVPTATTTNEDGSSTLSLLSASENDNSSHVEKGSPALSASKNSNAGNGDNTGRPREKLSNVV